MLIDYNVILDTMSFLTFIGARGQPRVQFQRRALTLPENTSYSDLTAFLTSASSPWEVDRFPYLQGSDGNGTGNFEYFLYWLWGDIYIYQLFVSVSTNKLIFNSDDNMEAALLSKS